MCGIVGYIGSQNATPILMKGLQALEYRGYDSAGIALLGQDTTLQVIKTSGRLSALESLVANQKPVGKIGIGHTRWATHGAPNSENSHPHCNESHTIAVVHNGIIENYAPLREELISEGYRFSSETDTEVIAHLLDFHYRIEKEAKKAIRATLDRLHGSYALGILFSKHPNNLFAAKKDSPLAIGIGQDEMLIASDVAALLPHTKKVVYLEDHELAIITQNSVKIYDPHLKEINKAPSHIEWNTQDAEKNGFAHFMLKEIHEQPAAIQNTLSAHLSEEASFPLSEKAMQHLQRIHIVACGSAFHAGVVGKEVIEALARIPVEVTVAGEFRYRNPILQENTLCLAISQSGETADTLAALRKAKENHCLTVAIVNVAGSSIAREADVTLFTHAGPEIAVATTKAYSAQLTVLYLLSLRLALVRQTITKKDYSDAVSSLKSIPCKVKEILKKQNEIRQFASQCAEQKDIFFIGRGLDYAASLEGSLKLKEVSYIHSEAYAASELKHGTISLIEKDTLVIALATQPTLYEKMRSNIAEAACRGAKIGSITLENPKPPLPNTIFHITLPEINPLFSPSLSAIPLQLFAYYVSLAKGLDIDKPRNLAKSVTVE